MRTRKDTEVGNTHNQKKKDVKATTLRDTQEFRAPLAEATSKFKRSFQLTYRNVKKVQSISGSTVTAQDGSEMDLKRIKIVPADSKDALSLQGGGGRFAQNTAGPERKRRDADPIIMALQEELDGRETALSITKASELLREHMRTEPESYDAVLRKAKGQNSWISSDLCQNNSN